MVDLVAERSKARPVRTAALEDFAGDASASELLRGWGNREVELGAMDDFRWAVAAQAEIAFWLVPSDAHRLSFRAWPFSWSQAPPQKVTVSVNDTSVAELALASGVRTYSIPVPPGTLVPGRNVVRFSFSRVDIPQQRIPGATDARTLAAAFLWVELSRREYAADSSRPEEPELEIAQATEDHLSLGAGEGYAFLCRLPNRNPRLFVTGLSVGEQDLQLGVWVRRERQGPRWLEMGKLKAGTPTEVDLSFAAGEKVELVFFAARPDEPAPASGGGSVAAVVAELAAPDSEVRAAQSHVVVDFEPDDENLFLRSGWSSPERQANSAESFAWAVGRAAELQLWLLPEVSQWLSLRAWPFNWQQAPPQHLIVKLNETKVADIDMLAGAATYAWQLPEGSVRAGENSVRFEFSRAGAPQALSQGSGESRPLAAAFAWLEVAAQLPPPNSLRPRLVASGDVRRTAVGVLLKPGEAVIFPVQPNRWIQPEIQFTLVPVGGPQAAVQVWALGSDQRASTVASRCAAEVKGSTCNALVETLAGQGGEIVVHASAASPPSSAARSILITSPRLVSRLHAPPRAEIRQAQILGRGGFKPNGKSLLLIDVDTLRADHLACYGGRTSTPTIDRLAARGVRYSTAWAPAPITGPSHAAIFAGMPPRRLQVLNNGQRLADGVVTLAEILKSHGYTTAAFVSLGVLASKFGFSQGFDVFDGTFKADWFKDAGEVNAAVFDWVREQREGPFFLWVHYSDPHEPYAPPDLAYPKLRVTSGGRELGQIAANGRGHRFSVIVPPGGASLEVTLISGSRPHPLVLHYASVDSPELTLVPTQACREQGVKTFLPTQLSRTSPVAVLDIGNNTRGPVAANVTLSVTEDLPIAEIRARYAREVEYCDAHIGRLLALLEAQGMLRDTAIMFLADHGESLGEHDHVGHISRLYEPALRVPFIVVKGGSTTPAMIVLEPVSLVDVAPTALDLLELEIPNEMEGASALSLGRDKRPARPLIAETFPPESPWQRQAVLWQGNKLIRTRSEAGDTIELFRLPVDPLELENQASREPAELAELLKMLAHHEIAQASRAAPLAPRLSDEERARLRSLGYIR